MIWSISLMAYKLFMDYSMLIFGSLVNLLYGIKYPSFILIISIDWTLTNTTTLSEGGSYPFAGNTAYSQPYYMQKCLPMVQETGVQSQVESYQTLDYG